MTRTLSMTTFRSTLLVATVLFAFGCSAFGCGSTSSEHVAHPAATEASHVAQPRAGETADPEGQKSVIFAGGCFWCMESDFEPLPGVLSVVSGYSGGTTDAPTYEQVGGHRTDHLEVVRVTYDPAQTSYRDLVELFWRSVDPTQADGQFCDRGDQYRTAIFFDGEEERMIAEESKARIAAQLEGEIDTRILARGRFWDAEDYHQDYYRLNPGHYQRYRTGCGRDRRLTELWGSAPHH